MHGQYVRLSRLTFTRPAANKRLPLVDEASGFVGMQSGARVKVLKTLERMKRGAPLYSAWKSEIFRNIFKSRSDISQLSGRLRSL
jgi:hypothetical protein